MCLWVCWAEANDDHGFYWRVWGADLCLRGRSRRGHRRGQRILVEIWDMKMALRVRLKFGDVFEVALAEGRVGYVQYVADDMSMLDSYVIRVFEGEEDPTQPPQISDIVLRKVSFYAHVFLKLCVKYGQWKKLGNAPAPDRVDVLFRGCWDLGNPEIKISHRWYVWRINEPFRDIGALTPRYQDAEIGSVLPPQSIVERMQTGTYVLGMPG